MARVALTVLFCLTACTEAGPPAETTTDQVEAAFAVRGVITDAGRRCEDDHQCRRGQTCDKARCQAHYGECVAVPSACPDVWQPECGCDGKTYGNACERRAARVDLAHAGECVQRCDGFAGLPCDEGEVCVHEPGTCAIVDGLGTCRERPESCPRLWDPVCGCDGRTYANPCEATRAGVSIDHRGQCVQVCGGIAGVPCPEGQTCELPPGECLMADLQGRCMTTPEVCPDVWRPVCDCQGKTWPNDCERVRAGAQLAHAGECVATCDEADDCPDPDAQLCRQPGCGEPGVCVARPSICTREYFPVCGCDGRTWENACVAWQHGVSVAHEGACPEVRCEDNDDCLAAQWCARPGCELGGTCQPRPEDCPDQWNPVCGCDGQTWPSRCDAAAAGVPVAHEGECRAICGGLAGVPCPDGQVCDMFPGTCPMMDQQGVCVPEPEVCTRIYAPVCGCDGKTHSNDCERIRAGVAKDHEGACECAPVTCDLYCRFGYQQGPDGCDICACKPGPALCCDPLAAPECVDATCCADGAWHCGGPSSGDAVDLVPPPICGDLGEGKVCEACCDPAAAPRCVGGASCCADGGWACNDDAGRPTCDIMGRVCRCSPVTCDLYCPWGFQVQADGCEICACNPPPSTCCDPRAMPGNDGNPSCVAGASCCGDGRWRCDDADPAATCGLTGPGHVCACPEPICPVDCAFGFAVDAAGCQTCECKPGPECPPTCDMFCRYGNVIDDNGCELCRCNPAPACCDPAARPECVDPVCCDDGAWHCGDATDCAARGEVCADPCAPVTCDLWCEHGFVRGPDGCEVCECARPRCCDPKAEPPCQHGAACCGDGGWSCMRIDGSSGCDSKGEVCAEGADVVDPP